MGCVAGAMLACGSGTSVTTDGGSDTSQPQNGQWVWQSDVPASDQLNTVWASAADDAWAGGDDGLMLHWNGTAWSVVDASTVNHIAAIWGSSASDVWAAAGGVGGPNAANLVHWNGTAWSPVDAGTTMNLKSLWGASANDVYAAGASGVAGTIQHFDGNAWSTIFPTTDTAPSSVSGSSSSDVWVVGGDMYPSFGDHYVIHGAGTSFSPEASGLSQSLTSVWSAAHDDAWAIGQAGFVHWNGSAWSVVQTPFDTNVSYADVFGLSSTRVWAVLGSQTIAAWDGNAWTAEHADAVGARLVAIGGVDASHRFAVGENATIMRFDTTLTAAPTCGDVHGQCGAANHCLDHLSDYACGGSDVCCVVETACGGVEIQCCDSTGNPGLRAICHNGAQVCPAGSQTCPQHP